MDLTYNAWWHKDEITVCLEDTIYYSHENPVQSPVSQLGTATALISALEVWDDSDLKLRLRFSYQMNCRNPDIRVTWGRSTEYTESDSWLGITRVDFSKRYIRSTEIVLNVDEKSWCSDVNIDSGTIRKNGCYSVYDTLIHEIGHAIGLNHSTDTNSYMFGQSSNEIYEVIRRDVTKEDLRVLRSVYSQNELTQVK